jgi:predicted acetyltransferase
MPSGPTAPHLADLALRYATEDTAEDFFVATLHGFHEEYQPAHWAPTRGVFEPGRNFGFTVDGRWISTCGAYSREMTVPGGSVPVAAITFVTVHPSYRRRGLLNQMMQHQLSDIQTRGTEPVALLWASESLIYGRYGYGRATPRLRITGSTRSTAFLPEVDLGRGSVGELERGEAIPAMKRLYQDWLPERPGGLARGEDWWDVKWHDPESWRRGASAYRFALHYNERGRPDGYVAFRVKLEGSAEPGGEVMVVDLDADNTAAWAALWRFVLDLDLVRRFRQNDAPMDEPLRYLVADQRAIDATLQDGTYARLVDVKRALEARKYATKLDVVIGVEDQLIPANHGAIRLQAGPDGAVATPTRRRADLWLSVRELGAIYLGGTSLAVLNRAGLVRERTPGSVAATAAAFGWSALPFCSDFF